MSNDVRAIAQRVTDIGVSSQLIKEVGARAATLEKVAKWRDELADELDALDLTDLDLGQILDVIEEDARQNGYDASHYGCLDKFDDVMHAIRTWIALQRVKAKINLRLRPTGVDRKSKYTDAQLKRGSELSATELDWPDIAEEVLGDRKRGPAFRNAVDRSKYPVHSKKTGRPTKTPTK